MAKEQSTGSGGNSSPFNRTAQHDAKRLAILSQAAMLFNSKGSRATTLKDIAESLGLTKTSLYYYVKTKEDLIYQCYMAALEHHQGNLDAAEAKYASPIDRASAYFLQYFEDWLAAQEGTGPHIAVLLEIASLKGSQRKDVESGYIAMFKRLRGYLRAGIEEESLRQFEPTSATRAIIGSIDWAFSWLHTIPRDEIRSTGREALDILAHGLSAQPGTYQPGLPLKEPREVIPLEGFNREEQNRLKQEAFYKTGTRFFNKQGFSGTSLDEIAEHLDVSKGAFYYHIKNKEDLLYNCYSRSLDIMARIYEEAEQFSGSGLEKIEIACRLIFHIQNSSEGPLIRYNSITALPMNRRKEILKRTEASSRRFGDFVRQGIEDGSVRPVNPLLAQEMFAGAINAAMEITLWRRVDDVDAAALDYFDIFFNGLLPRD